MRLLNCLSLHFVPFYKQMFFYCFALNCNNTYNAQCYFLFISDNREGELRRARTPPKAKALMGSTGSVMLDMMNKMNSMNLEATPTGQEKTNQA